MRRLRRSLLLRLRPPRLWFREDITPWGCPRCDQTNSPMRGARGTQVMCARCETIIDSFTFAILGEGLDPAEWHDIPEPSPVSVELRPGPRRRRSRKR